MATDETTPETTPPEPAWAPPLRVIGGIAGLLRSHAAAGRLDRTTAERLAGRLEEQVVELDRLLRTGGA